MQINTNKEKTSAVGVNYAQKSAKVYIPPNVTNSLKSKGHVTRVMYS